MIEILQVILPVFLLILMGYAATSAKFFTDTQAKIVMRFAVTFLVPCLLFKGIYQLDIGSVFKISILTSYYLPVLINFFITIATAVFLFKRDFSESISIGFSIIFSNSVLMGLATVELAFDDLAMETAVAVVAINAPFCYLLGTLFMEASRSNNFSLVSTFVSTMKQLLSNPLTIGIILGFIANLTGLKLPVFAEIAIFKMAAAAVPVALFGLGAVLVSYKIASQMPQVSFTCFIKLILHPLLAFVTAKYIFDLPNEIIQPIVILAAMPSGINSYVFASMYDKATGNAASTIIFSTLLSVITITVWLSVLS